MAKTISLLPFCGSKEDCEYHKHRGRLGNHIENPRCKFPDKCNFQTWETPGRIDGAD